MTSPRCKRQPKDWGQLGPAMQALPNDRWREFVFALCTQKPGHGSLTRAARTAKFGKGSTPANLAKLAWKLSHDERAIAAIAEESRKLIRVGHPEAAAAVLNLVRNPSHRDHMRAVAAVLDRADPIESQSRHSVEVLHRTVDPDVEALEELRALRHLGTPREKLLTLFGHNGLDRIEALEAVDNARRADTAKIIEGRVVARAELERADVG
ncbi:MAG: hypothetical protein ABI407_11470 [Bradyrhizobium sp.]